MRKATAPAAWPASNPLASNGLAASAPAWGSVGPSPSGANAVFADVSSNDPFARSRGSLRGRFQQGVFWVCLLAGASVIAYRNDYVLQLARASKNEGLFLSLEKRWFGGAPSGVPRQVKALLGLGANSGSTSLNGLPHEIPTIRLGPLPTSTNPSVGGDSSQGAPSAAAPSDAVPAVNAAPADESSRVDQGLQKLASPTTNASQAGATATRAVRSPGSTSSNSGYASSSRADTGSSASGYASSTRAESSVSSGPQRRSAAEIAEMKRRHWDKAIAKPEPAEQEERHARAQPEREAKPEPMPAPGTDDFLHMSIRQSVKDGKKKSKGTKEAKSKDRGGSKEYDPLNGEI